MLNPTTQLSPRSFELTEDHHGGYVLTAALGMLITISACSTTIIAPQDGHQWCVEVQSPKGSESDPSALTFSITEPGGGDPTGCLCFTTEENDILIQGRDAESMGNPLPAGYEALRDEIRIAARQRCIELSQTEFNPDPGACLCIPVGMQPTTGSALDDALYDMAIERCEDDLAALGAVTTRCEEFVSMATVDYEEVCDPDDWPPLPS